ncbi:MAG: hypothetical protein INR72_10875 [Williamsia herbipolensis]|nr:hypothetical protein [Williamsia herbipolensis]
MHDIQMLLEETIGDESVGSDSFVFITDERAGGLWTSDREGPRAQLTSHSLAVLLSEESAGTTAPALALLYRGEMQVDGPEHYLTALQNLWAAAAPVHDDATGRVIGVLRGGAAPVGRRHRRVGETCRDRRPLRRPDGRGDVRPDRPRERSRGHDPDRRREHRVVAAHRDRSRVAPRSCAWPVATTSRASTISGGSPPHT